MNLKIIIKYIGKVLAIEAILLLIPLWLTFYDKSGDSKCFLISIAMLAAVSIPTFFIKNDGKIVHAKEGFATVGLSWLAMSFFGAMPYYFSGSFLTFADCFFEAISGFTTTGATVIADVESLSRGILMWRNLTLWIGGMGVLVFTIALMPHSGGSTSQIMKAESPGPAPTKLVPKLADSSKILYIIYTVMTLALTLAAYACGIPFFGALSHALSSAATGGFSVLNASVSGYNNPVLEWVLGIGMFCFGINFTIFFYLLKKDFKSIKVNEEFRFYVLIILGSTILIAISLISQGHFSLGSGIRHSFFQVSSIMTTTGLTTADIDVWPGFAKILLFLLMFFGGSSGSTACGIKIVRVLLVGKLIMFEMSRIIHPRAVNSLKLNGKPVNEQTIRSICTFFMTYIVIYIGSVLLISVDGFDFETNMTAVASTLNNIGIGFSKVSASGGLVVYSGFSKFIMCMCMLIGRLEIFPILLLLSPSFWKKVNI